jgi:hypothetical protein
VVFSLGQQGRDASFLPFGVVGGAEGEIGDGSSECAVGGCLIEAFLLCEVGNPLEGVVIGGDGGLELRPP